MGAPVIGFDAMVVEPIENRELTTGA